MSINAAWHKAHRMPKNPTFEQRVAWHRAHQRHCACRSIPAKLLRQIEAFESRTRRMGKRGQGGG